MVAKTEATPGDVPFPPHREDRWDRTCTRERFLAYRKTRDVRIRNEIVSAHLNLVKWAVARYAHRGQPLEDLYQVGCVGLIRAVDSFQVDMGTHFVTYAMPTIVGEIKHYFRDNAWSVRVPRRLKELCLGVGRATCRLTHGSGRPPSTADLASALQVPEKQVRESQALLCGFTLSLDADWDQDCPGASSNCLLGQEDDEIRRFEGRTTVKQLLLLLPHRDRLILYLRYFLDCPLKETAEIVGISAVHVSRVVGRVLAQLRPLLLAPGGRT